MKRLLLVIFLIYFCLINGKSDDTIKIAEDIELIKISETTYIHTSYYDIGQYINVPANGLLYVKNKKAVLVDTPWDDDQTRRLFNYIKDSLHIEINHIIPTHYHIDCMGGLAEAHRQNSISYSLELTVQKAIGKNLPQPQNTFTDSIWLNINDRDILLIHFGHGHTDDAFMVWIPDEYILFGGCSVKSTNAQNLGNIAEANLEAWLQVAKQAKNRFNKSKLIVPGHGPYGGIELLDRTVELLEESVEEE